MFWCSLSAEYAWMLGHHIVSLSKVLLQQARDQKRDHRVIQFVSLMDGKVNWLCEFTLDFLRTWQVSVASSILSSIGLATFLEALFLSRCLWLSLSKRSFVIQKISFEFSVGTESAFQKNPPHPFQEFAWISLLLKLAVFSRQKIAKG